MKIISNIYKTVSPYLYPVFRILIGLMFFLHGLQKMTGLFGGIDGARGLPLAFSLIWWAGIIEFVAGAFIALGVFSRFMAFISAIEMIAAYFIGHYPNGINPITNGGELAILYLASFLTIVQYGAKKWSIDKILKQ